MSRIGRVALGIAVVTSSCVGADDDSIDTSPTTEAPPETDAPVTAEAPVETEAPSQTDAPPATEAPVVTEPPAPDNILGWVTSDEPEDLHPDDPDRSSDMSTWIVAPLMEGLYGETAAIAYTPELLAGDGALTQNPDGSIQVDFVLRDGLTWSDGTPMTADDVRFTLDATMAADGLDESGNPAFVYDRQDRQGYDTITGLSVASDTEFSVTWSDFYPDYRGLFDRVYPSHVFSEDPVAAANELNDAFRDWNGPDGNILPSSGPMLFNSWEPGVQITLDTNSDYHGSTSPDVTRLGQVASIDGVRIDFVPDTNAEIDAITTAEAQIIFSTPDPEFADLASSEDFTVASSPGVVFDHWGLNLNNPHLAKPDVREGIAFAMDKREVVEGLYAPLFGDLLPAEGLGNAYWLSNHSSYEDHAGDAGYGAGDIAAAQASLEAAGYVLNDDGIYEHPDDGELSLRVGTPSGNRLREIQQELIQAQMADAGIDIVIDNVEGTAYFGEIPFSAEAIACSTTKGADGDCGVWDIAQFPLIASPEPNVLNPLFRTGSPSNPYGYPQPFFDQLADECDAIIDDVLRAQCYNELDRHITLLRPDFQFGLFLLPISQKPTFYGVTSDLSAAAVAPDAKGAGPLANVVDFVFAD